MRRKVTIIQLSTRSLNIFSGSGDFLGSDDEEEFMDGFYTASSERGLTPDGDLSSLALFSYQEDEVEDDMLPSLISEDESDL